jgi:beta-glucosidase
MPIVVAANGAPASLRRPREQREDYDMRARSGLARPLAFAMAALFSMAAVGAAQTPPYRDPAVPTEERITNLLSQMTIEEKVVTLGGFGSGVPRLGVPSFGSSEGIHGVVSRGNPARGVPAITTTQFPQPPGMGSSWNPDLVRQAGGVQGAEGRYISMNPKYKTAMLMLWGPQADLARDPRWGRSEEVYGEDPFFNGVMATSFARGIQGNDPKYWQAAPLLKHFLANSNENGRMSSNSQFDERLFWEYYSVPFRVTFQDAGANAVMASYNAWNGTPLTIHPLLRDILIAQWGVQVISSDGGAVQNLWEDHKVLPDQKAAVVASLKAGVNQFLDRALDDLRAAVKEGLVTEKDLDEGLRRKFRITLKLGLLDPPELVPYTKAGDGPAPWDGTAHLGVSKRMALESIVLLKNDRGALPLAKGGLKSVAVIGPRADAVYWDWYGGTPPHAITPLQGIRDAVGPGVAVNYAADDEAGAAVKAAAAADVAIVVVGNHPTCGPNMGKEWTRDGNTVPCADPGEGREGRDRETLTLSQEELVRKVHAANPRTVMVLVSSFPYTINWSQAHVPAIVHMAHSSQDEGWALAQVLFGDYNPGGHTVVTWPASLEQLPPMMDYDIRHGRTYMYAKGAPLYPFGHGLSYTTFRFSKLRTDKVVLAADGRLAVSVEVTNTGKVAGDAVPQLYIRHLGSKVERPSLALAGFSRVHLAPGETRTVQLPLKASQLAYWDTARKALVVEKEPVRLMLGASAGDLQLHADVQVQ